MLTRLSTAGLVSTLQRVEHWRSGAGVGVEEHHFLAELLGQAHEDVGDEVSLGADHVVPERFVR